MQRAAQGRRRQGQNLVVAGVLGLTSMLTGGVTAAAVPAVPLGMATVVDDPVDGAGEWAVAPADEDGPDGRVSLRHAVDPGQTVRDAIAVTNLGAAPATYVVLAGDGVVGETGAFDVQADDPRAAGAWLAVEGLDAGELEVDAGATAVLPVTIAVPADALPGYHTAGVVVAVSQAGGGVTVTHRVGVRVHLEVSGELEPVLTVTDIRSTYSGSWVPFMPGTVRMEYTLANEGNVRLGGNVHARTAGPAGVARRGATDTVVELLPGDVVTRTVEVPAWPLVLLSGQVTASATAVGQDRVPLPGAAELAVSVVAIPWAELVLVLGALGAVVWLRRRSTGEVDAPVPVQRDRNAAMSSSFDIEDRPWTSSSAARLRSSSTVHSS